MRIVQNTVACPRSPTQAAGSYRPHPRSKSPKCNSPARRTTDVDSFKKRYGDDIYRADPNNFFWVIPYGALGLGLLAIYFFLRQSFQPKAAKPAATAAPEVVVDPRYMEAAEKETSRLDQ